MGCIMNNEIKTSLKNAGIIAIVRNIPYKFIPDTVDALLNGGINAIEVTLNREDSYKSIKWISDNRKNVFIGAGTVITVEQVLKAKEHGAKYIISPNMCAEVIIETKRQGLISLPGCVTPTEMTTAISHGADLIKLFPASVFGPEYVKALLSPLPDTEIIAVGGISLENIELYKKAGIKTFGIGGNLVDLNEIERGNYNKIQTLAAKYIAATCK